MLNGVDHVILSHDEVDKLVKGVEAIGHGKIGQRERYLALGDGLEVFTAMRDAIKPKGD